MSSDRFGDDREAVADVSGVLLIAHRVDVIEVPVDEGGDFGRVGETVDSQVRQ